MRFTGALALVAACTTLCACQLAAGITDRTLERSVDAGASAADATIGATDAGDPGDGQVGDGARGAGCTSNSECTDEATREGERPGPDASFTGTLDGGVVPAVCLRSRGQCVRLLTQDCRDLYGDYRNDDSILIGTLFDTSGRLAGSNIPRQEAALLAAQEINSSASGGGIPGPDGGVRPLLVLECDPAGDAIRTAQHLANDLQVPAVVGPDVAEDGIGIRNAVSAQAGMLLMTPTISVDSLTASGDGGLTWRDVPSDRQRAPVYGDQMEEIATELRSAGRSGSLRLGLVVRNDTLGLSALEAIGGLPWDGISVGSPPPGTVSLDEYALSDTAAQAAIATRYATTFVPDVVFVVAEEAVASVVIPLEQKLTAMNYSGPRPYYLATDTSKAASWLSTPPGLPSDFQRRVRGVGVTPGASSTPVFDSFRAAFAGAYGTNPGVTGMGPSYDAMYSIAYAMAATKGMPVTGASVAQGLTQLLQGPAFSVGIDSASAAFQALASAGQIALTGTFTLMQWDTSGDIAGGTLQVWCISSSGSSPAFADSGRRYDIATARFSGAYNAPPDGGAPPCAVH